MSLPVSLAIVLESTGWRKHVRWKQLALPGLELSLNDGTRCTDVIEIHVREINRMGSGKIVMC